LLRRAARRQQIAVNAAAPAEAAKSIGLGGRVRFRHPLVGYAVYQAASLVTGGRRIGTWPGQPIRTPIPIAGRGIASRGTVA
jgi:hypothetical protein